MMIYKTTLSLFFLILTLTIRTQTIPLDRVYAWDTFGLKDTTTSNFNLIDLNSQGLVGDGVTANDSLLEGILNSLSGVGNILLFPAGTFLFEESIELPSNVVLKGAGAEETILKFNQNSSGHSINIQGSITADTTKIIHSAAKDSSSLIVYNSSLFNAADWIRIIQQDADLVNDSWALNTVGQIVQIDTVINDIIYLSSSMRTTYDISRDPYIKKISPKSNVGIECLKIIREDFSDKQWSNIRFSNSVNCWISGLESEKCNFSHVELEYSSNISVARSYFHEGHNYGSGGKAYGVLLHFTSNECFIEDNVFERLRHSVLLQAGANGNVIAYNYSRNPYWTDVSFIIPENSAGELVLHGNWPYANLFEQNVVDNIVIDDSHGSNGPHNTFFRNRARGYGIFFSAPNSPDQNIVGNEITNEFLPSPYSLFNYNILGTGHFLYANNKLGTIDPVGTDSLQDITYAYSTLPEFLPSNQLGKIGVPQAMEEYTIPAYDRHKYGAIFSNSCGENHTGILVNDERSLVYPNPFENNLKIVGPESFGIEVYDSFGKRIYAKEEIHGLITLQSKTWANGLYILKLKYAHQSKTYKLIKNNN